MTARDLELQSDAHSSTNGILYLGDDTIFGEAAFTGYRARVLHHISPARNEMNRPEAKHLAAPCCQLGRDAGEQGVTPSAAACESALAFTSAQHLSSAAIAS
jgi:hypothetical protein